ncbi:M23 family metallopeptidase [Reichenbachiella sp. MALMAid0571]|uniref:M23 family metallopeptidase n=1 Tax=Reichenbachiella sp. MALMAid0571 TaxID=3143939 RepID=UPI0032E042EE
METKKTFSNRLVTKYLLIIRNEENFAEKTTFTFSYIKIILGLVSIFLVLAGLSFYMATTLLKQWFDPRHAEMQANRQLMNLSMEIDSLIVEVNKKDQFIDNIKMILSGKDNNYVDSENNSGLNETELLQANEEISESLNPIDSQFRKEFEKEGLNLQFGSAKISEELQDFYLFKPVDKGVVLNKFNPQEEHYAIDIAAKEDESVMAVADGTVVFAGWTLDHGNVIAIQHRGNIISLYKHNSDLLKNVGSFVTAGEVIAIIGNTGELTSGPHLHFELWYNGNPVDPEDFIRF